MITNTIKRRLKMQTLEDQTASFIKKKGTDIILFELIHQNVRKIMHR